MSILMEFGARIKRKRIELKMTQDELARKVGYTSRSSINKIELGLVDLPQSKIAAIANVLGVSPGYLIGWENSSSGINNGIIGNYNSNNVVGCGASGEVEIEIVSLCKKMSMQQKTRLLMFAYELLEITQ